MEALPKHLVHCSRKLLAFASYSCPMHHNLEDILHNFSKLIHLRYLRFKLEYYGNFCLPNALFRMHHLEVTDMQSVVRCASSAKNMSNLVKLRHFLVSEDKLTLHSDIFGVGKLEFFQELKEFRVGRESDGFELSQLGSLTEIGGSLGIYNLENVQTKEEANESKLLHKNYIRELVLEWDVKRPNKEPVKEENVLGSLVPHRNLQELCIRGHGGTNCPSWLCANLLVKCLQSLCLDGVSWKNLPPLGEMWMVNELGEEYQCCSMSPPGFHSLKSLKLSNISRLTKWVGKGPCSFFSHLEVLVIKDCSELMELPFSNPPTCSQAQREERLGWFPNLRELVIVDCPELASVPSIPWRTGATCSAEIAKVGSGIERLIYSTYRSKLRLQIEGKDGQGNVLWNGLNFSNLTDLEELHVNNVPLLKLDYLQFLTSLKKIMICDSSTVLPVVEGDRCHGIYRCPVEYLEISRCDASGKELTLLLSFLPNLSKLQINMCENITGLGVVEDAETVSGEQQQRTRVEEEEMITSSVGLLLLPPHLHKLRISSCPQVRLLSDHHAAAAGEGGLQRLHSLRILTVICCPELLSSYSSSSFFPFPACLQELTLWDVKYMDTLQALSNLTSLTKLTLNKAGGSRDEGLWPLLARGRLTELTLGTNSNFFASPNPSRPHDIEVFSQTSKLFDLSTDTSTGFLAAPICSLLSSTLTKLDLGLEPKMERFTEEQEEALQILTSLQELQLSRGAKLQQLPACLHKLINLKKLGINYFEDIQSLPGLPSCLHKLEIKKCGALKSLPNSLPGSLEILRVSYCRGIKSLPKAGLPSSMRELYISLGNSEELKMACRKLIGTIPIVRT
ncbi:hypothetical protein ACQJBY_017992 [Aegilops geniculata]